MDNETKSKYFLHNIRGGEWQLLVVKNFTEKGVIENEYCAY